ncbi:MAG: MlaD family protein [Nitrospiraceae bacterium]|nr:MlaD family protein [Nitrospiraceae bacterium]
MFDLKKQLRWAEMKVGVIISLALAILFLSVFFAGSIESIIHPKARIQVAIFDVKGLKKGAPVWVYGLEEGSVEDISLNPEYGTVVTLSIYKKVLGYLKEDSTASVLTMGLLGDKYIELNPGVSEKAPLKPGAMIYGTPQLDMKDVMETGASSIQKINDFIEKLGKLVEKIETSKGTLARFLDDPSLYDNLKDSSRHLSVIIKDIEAGKGSLGQLVNDRSLYNSLVSTSKSLEAFSQRIENGSGTINKLIDDHVLYDRLTGAATSMEEFGKKVNDPKGTIGKLAADPELYDNLNASSRRIASILEKIEKGQGTAGLLVKDEELAHEVKETVVQLKKLMEDIRQQPRKYFKFSVF